MYRKMWRFRGSLPGTGNRFKFNQLNLVKKPLRAVAFFASGFKVNLRSTVIQAGRRYP
jgi:hypothetical protein